MEKFQDEVLRRLDAIIKLLTLGSMKDKTQKEKIVLLDGAGFGPKQIADILATSSNSVSVALSNIRKKGKEQEVKAVANESVEANKNPQEAQNA